MTDAPKPTAEMPPTHIHSEEAWAIASQYSWALASGTRDLAARIDEALAKQRAILLPADDAEMVERVRKAVSPQISEGLGAVLRKFCDSDHAAKARFHLHAMPDSDWKTLIDMLSSEAARAALSAMRGEP